MSFLEDLQEITKEGGLHNINDYLVALEGQTVLGNSPPPTRGFISIVNIRGDERYYNPEDWAWVEMIDGTFETNQIWRRHGNILEFKSDFNRDPKPGGAIRKLLGKRERVFRHSIKDKNGRIISANQNYRHLYSK